ncbi:MAG: hypothetical protein MUF15_06755 [Acidobacteria bacterium]|jgi:hypothetical protein|nr:hypothetical protein [Acidobacteriota bacterium]
MVEVAFDGIGFEVWQSRFEFTWNENCREERELGPRTNTATRKRVLIINFTLLNSLAAFRTGTVLPVFYFHA